MSNYAITIDLGGTKILSAMVDNKDTIIVRDKTATEIKKGPDGIVDSMVESVNNLLSSSGVDISEIKGICMGVPGIINPTEGIVYNAPNLGIKNYNVKEKFTERINLPLYLENDVNLAAMGIKRVELKNKVKNMLVVFIGTGIGAALVFNGKLYRGSSFFAGEIGHLLLNVKKARKHSGTIEEYSSRTAIVERITKDIKEGKKSVLAEYVKTGRKIKSKALAQAVKKGDKLVIEHFEESMETLGTILSNLQTLLNFDSIVLGGGVVEAMGDFILPRIEHAFRNSVFDATGDCVKIFPTAMGDDAPIYGGWEVIEEYCD